MLHGGVLTTDAFAATYDRLAESTIEPGWLAKAVARLRARALDRALIAGTDPAQSPWLAARAGRLTSTRNRALIAAGIERVLDAAHEPSTPTRVAPRRASVTAHAEELRDLADLLRGRSPLYARGIAMLGALLRDGAGPVYAGEPAALAQRLHEARTALAG